MLDNEINQLKYEKSCLKKEIAILRKENADLDQDLIYFEKFILLSRALLENAILQELQRMENSMKTTEKQASISFISVSG